MPVLSGRKMVSQESIEAFPWLRSPSVVQPEIGVVLGLPEGSMAVRKQDLQPGLRM